MFKDLFSYIKIPLIWWNVLLEVLYHIYNWWYHYLFAEICYLFAERKILELVRVMSDAFLQFTRIIWHYWVHFWSQKFKSPTYWPMSPFYSLTLLEAYTVPISHFPSITHVHIPINAFSSRGGANIPWCTVMEPPGGLWLAWITEHPLEMVAGFLPSSHSGGYAVDSFELFPPFFLIWGKLFMLVTWDLKEIKENCLCW